MSTDTDTGDAGPLERWIQSTIQNPGKAYKAMFYVATLSFLFTTLFPFYWLLVVALTPTREISNIGYPPVPVEFSLDNFDVFVRVFTEVPFHYFMFNSFVLALMTTAIVLVVASLAGYVFGRLEFPGRGPLLILVLVVSYFPPAAFLLPLYELFTGNVGFTLAGYTISSPNLYNTPWSMTLPFSALFMPLSIFILTTFYSQIPDGLEDAARIEGTTRLGALFRVIIPLSAPGVVTAGVLTFISVYNEFFFSFIMNNGEPENWAPIVQGIIGYQGHYQQFFNLQAAASIIGVLPIAILVVIAQEKIVSGLTAGALKE